MSTYKKPRIGKGSTIAKSAIIEPGAVIGAKCRVEAHSTIRSGVNLGAGSYVGQGVILGERLRSFHVSPKKYKNPPLKIGPNAILRAGTIISAGSKIGSHFETGPYVTIREKSIIGNHSRFGNYSDIQGECKIGNYVAAHSNVTVGQYSVVQDYVWLHPFVVLINDWYPPTGIGMKGPTIGKYSVLGANAVIYPGIRLGTHVIVAAQSSVKHDVKSYQVVAGQPAKVTIDSRKLFTHHKGKMVRPYPWMEHRVAGYPWEKKKSNKSKK